MKKHPRSSPVSETIAQPRGCIDGVQSSGMVDGWCAGPAGSIAARRVAILVDGAIALRDIACSIYREDLRAAGIGDGHHGFRVQLPAAFRPAGRESLVEMCDQETDAPIGTGVYVIWGQDWEMWRLEGHIDSISDEGMMLGWCWDLANPERRVVLNVLADGEKVGTTVAGLYRDDLRSADKADGHCGFSFFLPWQSISSRAEVSVVLQDSESGLPIGQGTTLRRPLMVSAEQRIEGLERQLQLLRTELQTAETRAARAEDARQAPDLFKVAAAFFQDLAEGRPRAGLMTLRCRLEDASSRLPLISLGSPSATDTTILVLPDGRVDRLHACLSALHRAGADAGAHVMVLDMGEGDGEDLALIHAGVRHLRLLRLRGDETINDLLRGIATPFIALLPCHVEIGPAWLRQLTDQLRRHKRAGLASAQFASPTGQSVGAALVADAVHGLRAGAAAPVSEEVDAIDGLCICLRAEMLWALGGFNLNYDGFAGQFLDLCLRARRAGWQIALAPDTLGRSAEAAPSLLDRISAEEAARLRALCAAKA